VEGLSFQRRIASPLRKASGVASASRSFAFGYCGLTTAFVLAWFAAPVDGHRHWWQTFLIGVVCAASLFQIGWLNWISFYRWDAEKPWRDILEEEQGPSSDTA
jgi:hypothetical protein